MNKTALPIVKSKDDFRMCRRHHFLKNHGNKCSYLDPKTLTLCSNESTHSMYCRKHFVLDESNICMGILKCGCRCSQKKEKYLDLCKDCEEHVLLNNQKYTPLYFRPAILSNCNKVARCLESPFKQGMKKTKVYRNVSNVLFETFSSEIVFKIIGFLSLYEVLDFINYEIEPFIQCLEENLGRSIVINLFNTINNSYYSSYLNNNNFKVLSYSGLLKLFIEKYCKDIVFQDRITISHNNNENLFNKKKGKEFKTRIFGNILDRCKTIQQVKKKGAKYFKKESWKIFYE